VGQPAPHWNADEAPDHCHNSEIHGYATVNSVRITWRQKSVLPTVHGFDEFFGYLLPPGCHEDPCHLNYQRI